LFVVFILLFFFFFFFSSRRRHTRFSRDWSSDVCSSDLNNKKRLVHARPYYGYGGPWGWYHPWGFYGYNYHPFVVGEQRLRYGHKIGRASCREECRCRWWPDSKDKQKRM